MQTRDVLSAVLTHARQHPASPAARDDARELSYAALRCEVSRLAAGLAHRGVRSGDRVALQLPNSVDFLVAALACMWVGAMFVPIAVTDPPGRVERLVEDCDAALVLANSAVADPHPDAEQLAVLTAEHVTQVAPILVNYDRAAYAIYTSGTTGKPKGVVIGRRAFARAIRAAIDSGGFDGTSRGLCVSPFHFDGSFGTLFTTVAAGGAVVIPPRDSLLFARYFLRTVVRERITHTSFSPSYLRLLLASPQLPLLADSHLRVVALGGEACSAADVALLRAAAPRLRVFNRYGPTESTIAVSHFEITQQVLDNGGPVPIGVPHPDVTFHLVDTAGALIEQPGQVGELYIGGGQLMIGYWGAPELTAQLMPTDIVPGQPLYRTGDLVRRDADGNYVYVDRADRVVKRNAVRISLVELGDVLRSLDGVAGATCSPFDNDGDLGIVAFLVAKSPRTSADLRLAAAEHLPSSMLPDRIELVDELPLTSSSKVDERRLLAQAGLRGT